MSGTGLGSTHGAAESDGSGLPARGEAAWYAWRSLRDCRLCRSVAFSVFVLIMLIESVILVPSAMTFYDNELSRLEQKAVVMVETALLADGGGREPARIQSRMSGLLKDEKMLGLSVRSSEGSIVARAGDADFRDLDLDAVRRDAGRVERRWALGGRCFDIAWSRVVAGERLVLAARMDSSTLDAALAGFVLRIAGLVALIVVVVTGGTMLVVHRSVLGPMLRLRQSMLAAAADPGRADEFRIGARPRDETGEMFQAHDEMLARVAESMRADRQRAVEEARFLSRHDTLTGLPNRDFFREHLREAQAAACRRGEEVQVLVLNLDDFGAINDALGQSAGDQVLIEVARRLDRGIEAGQFAARLGGDEFGIVNAAGGTHAGRASALAERILADVARPFMIAGNELRLRARIGIACIPSGCADDETAVLHDAEVALGRIRTDAAIRYQFFSPEMTQEAQRRQEIQHGLRIAVESGELQLFYQPKVALDLDASAKRIQACEALIRWRHPVRGYISPAEFIPVAESGGQIFSIGEWVLREACAQIRRWQDAGLAAPRTSVNISARQFRDPGLPDLVRRVIEEAGIGPDLLELEITETAAMEDVAITVEVISALRRLGVRISIDDFGTGYSSLSYLRRLDIDSIKIDKSFVDDIGLDPNADAICDAIIRLGHSLGRRVVAEGVETPAQAQFLRARRCEEAQGFLFARPMPADGIADALPLARTPALR